MLNDKNLFNILQIKDSSLKLDDIQWKTQESNESSLLFYRIGIENNSHDQFHSRIAEAKFGWLIVNKAIPDLPKNSSVVAEELWPEVQKKCSDLLYPMPTLKMIALTGTNGKTTTTDIVLQLGELMGKSGLSIGTLGVRENQKTILDFGLTSPSYIDLRKFLFKYGQSKDFCVLEASSHALLQNRLYGISFDGAGWLSFSQDHLDYHQTMDAYFEAKFLLLDQLTPSAKLFVPTEQLVLFDKLKNKTEHAFKAAPINQEMPAFFRTRFNRNNLEVAVAILEDVFKQKVPKSWDKIIPPDGRFYIRPYKSNYIIVDSAHTPDALDNICRGIREAFPEHKFKILFGCGGDRDKTKRAQMGRVAENWSDVIYLTSDNPRSEAPAEIIDDIAKGIRLKKFYRITERPIAVKQAFSELREKEVLLLAGKGHENYILINGVKQPYSDITEVEEFLRRIKND